MITLDSKRIKQNERIEAGCLEKAQEHSMELHGQMI